MSSYRERALNKTSNKVASKPTTSSSYRQRALNRTEPKVEEVLVEKNKYNFTPENVQKGIEQLNSPIGILGTVRRTTETKLPEIISEKKLEREEQERWDSLSVPEKIVDPFKTMGANIKYGDLGIEENQAWAEYRSKQDAESLAKAQAATKAREDYEASNDRIGKGNAFTKDFAQYLPQLGGQLASGLGGAAGGAAAGAVGGAGVALAAGQLGPQVLVPEEIATVPAGALTGAAWGGKGGYVAGTAKYSYDLMAGSAYKTLLDMGVPNEVALELSGDEALINSLIEGAGSVVDLISLGIGKLGTKGATTAAKKVAQNRLLAAAKAYGMNLVSEPLEEGAQQLVSIDTQKKAAEKAGIERNVTEAEDRQSILDSMRSGLNVAAITGLGNVAGNVAVNSMSNNLNTNADTRNLPTIDNKTLTQLTEINKNIEEQQKASRTAQPEKNVARELPTMASQQAMLPTNRIEAEMAQTGNMEQTSDMSKMPANFMQNRPTYEVEIEKILPFMDDRMGHRESDKVEKLKENIKKNGIETPIELRTNANGEVTINDGHHRLQIAKELGIKNIPVRYLDENSQKTIEADTFKEYNTPIDERWGTDVDGIGRNVGGQNQGSGITEENGTHTGTLSDRTDTTTENDRLYREVQRFDNRPSSDTTRGENIAGQTINEADTQSAFSMPKNYIDPSQDIQKATEFVSKATVEDIDTLNKMVEEAEKYPDRLDLQFFAEKAREAIEKLSRQQVRQAIMEETGVESYNLDDVNKISKVKMNFTTPVRVIEKIFNKETANKINENFFKPIKHNEAERIRRLNKERADIKELDIKPGSAEDAAIQKYGEGEYVDENGLTIPYTLENLKRDFPDTWQKLQNATNVIRNKYDTYLEEINEVLQDNGYDPIPKRKDYFRHFEELNDLFSVLGVPTKVDDIPTDLNGMTADLKPGKQFFANALQRKGKKTTYSAVKGIDGYLDGAMNILYHTKDIQKLRTLDKYIRDTYGQAKGLADANTMTDEQKAKRINQINEGHLSEFAAWLTEYTNALAGKKSRLDRGIEEMFGRKAYKYLNLIKKQVGANMTGLNVNSALSNFISVTQAAPKTNKKALVKGTIDTVKNIFANDGFIDKSDFLTTRFGTDKLAKNWWQKAGDVGQIFMSGTDYFTANLITRSKYQEFLDKGYTEAEAIKKADEFADRLMAGRGKGDLPTAFESKTLGIVTQFQLEVTNQLDSIFYDTLHEDYAAESNSKLAKEHPKFYNAASATFILGQIFALAFLYNEGKEELTGTEGGALDPIGTIVDAIKYLTDENLSKPEAIAKIVEDIANQLPFASIITGGGRLPIKEAFPDLLSVAKGEAKLGDEMWKLTNLLLPTGGGQIKKTTQGLSTFAKGGSYTKDAEGKDKLKYPVEQIPSNAIKSAVFGKWATPGAKDYIDRGFKPLSANQTEAYEKAMKAGISSDDFFKVYDATRGIESDKDRSGKTIENSKSEKLKEAIDKATPKLTSKQRKILYDAFNVSKTVQGGY